MTNLQGSLRVSQPRGRVLLFLLGVLALLLALLASMFNGTVNGIVHAASPSISSNISYRIVNRNSSIVLDVAGSSKADGVSIDQANDAGTINQEWQFVAVGTYYQIVNQNSGKALEVNGAKVDQRTYTGGTNQQWQLVTVNSSYYRIINRSSGKVLEVTGSSLATGARIVQNSDTGATSQQWILFQAGSPIFPPGIKALINVAIGIRDTYIMRGPDGIYYMTGTQANAWQNGTGIELWSSTDLKTWTDHGYIWTFTQAEQDGCWCAKYFPYEGASLRVIWAPELHYLDGTYFIPFTMPGGGTGILKSASGKITGPYHSITSNYIAARHIDSSLFQDDDGTIYYLDKGRIGKMKSDMSGLAEPLRTTNVTEEGVEMIKRNGVYILASADFSGSGYYNSEVQQATNIYGPYTGAYEAVPWAGHGNYFQDAKGQWWCTMFGNKTTAPVYHQPAIVPVKFGPGNQIRVDLNPRV